MHALAHACTLPCIERTQPNLRDLLNWVKKGPLDIIDTPDSNIEHTALKLIKSFKTERSSCTFPVGRQHCAKELLTRILAHDDTGTKLASSGSIVNLLSCPNLKCATRLAEEPFSLIDLPLPSGKKTTKLSLNVCLSKFFETEKLREKAHFHCPACSARSEGQTKTSVLSHVNQGLIITLQRSQPGGHKDNRAVDSPLHGLDISGISFPPIIDKFDLHAVVLHRGKLSTQGHYTTACLDDSSLQWLLFNDGDPVSPLLNTSNELSGNGEEFILFYRRRLPIVTTPVPKPTRTGQTANRHRIECDFDFDIDAEIDIENEMRLG